MALIFSLLSIAGFQLRSDDPAAMKDFVQSAHARAAEASSEGNLSTRAQVLPHTRAHCPMQMLRAVASCRVAAYSQTVCSCLPQESSFFWWQLLLLVYSIGQHSLGHEHRGHLIRLKPLL